MTNPFRKIRLFYDETASELKKSVWPTWLELRDMTIVVLIGIALIGCYLAIADFALVNFVQLFTDLVR